MSAEYMGIGCGAIVIRDEKVLLVKYTDGEWSRPGGEVGVGELVHDAIIREVKEETGIDVEVIRFLKISRVIQNGRRWVAMGYVAKYVSGDTANLEPHKHDQVEWFKLNSLPDNLNAHTKKSIDIYIREECG